MRYKEISKAIDAASLPGGARNINAGKSPMANTRRPYTRSRKTQVCEADLGLKDLTEEVNELKGKEEELKEQVRSKEDQLEIEKQLNL